MSFDVGTTSMKTCLFDQDLRLVLRDSQEYRPCTPAPDIVELPPDAYWRALLSGIGRMLRPGITPANIEAIAITTQGETLIPIDHEGNALTDAIVWLDARAGSQAAALNVRIKTDLFYQTTGLPDLSGATPIAKLMWLRETRPDIYAQTHKFLLLEDYLIFRLTGAPVSEHSLLSSTGYFDIRTRKYADAILSSAGIDEAKLPTPLWSGTIAGRLTREAARATGLIQGTPVATTAMDQICGMIGAGNTREGILTETTGTCLTVGASVRHPNFSSAARPNIYAHYDDGFAYLPYNQTAAIVLKWFRDTFFPDLEPAGSYDQLSAMVSGVALGSDGLLLPHFAGKLVPSSQPGFKGSFLGVGLDTTRAHFVRAIFEGVGFMLRENVQLLRELGIEPDRVLSLGGGSNSDPWCQIKADILGLPVDALRVPGSTSLGAAGWRASRWVMLAPLTG